jgi:hypothetical protein
MAIETIGKDLVRTQKHYWREVILGHAVLLREAGGISDCDEVGIELK